MLVNFHDKITFKGYCTKIAKIKTYCLLFVIKFMICWLENIRSIVGAIKIEALTRSKGYYFHFQSRIDFSETNSPTVKTVIEVLVLSGSMLLISWLTLCF